MSEDSTPSVKTAAVPARTKAGTNWIGAFFMYAKGATLQELSEQLAIPLPKLKTRAREEDWDGLIKTQSSLALRAPSVETAPQSALVIANAAARIKANREEAFAVAIRLRKKITKKLDDYDAKNLELTPAEIYTLARAAASLDTSAMLALGDDPSPKLPPPPIDPNAPRSPGKDDRPVTHFHINLPPAALAPRRVNPDVSPPLPHSSGRAADPFMAPTPGPATSRQNPSPLPETIEPKSIAQTVVLEPETIESEIIETPSGRQAIDFEKLGKIVRAVTAQPKVSVPDIFK